MVNAGMVGAGRTRKIMERISRLSFQMPWCDGPVTKSDFFKSASLTCTPEAKLNTIRTAYLMLNDAVLF